MGQLEPEAGAVHQYCALPPGLHGAVVGQQPQKRPCAMPGCGALPVDNFGTAVCHGAPPSGALARLRSCLFCRNDGYHLADKRPAVRGGAVLSAHCLGAAFAGPPTAHKGCIGNAGCRKRYLHNAISIRLAYLLKNCLSPKCGDRQFFDSAISYFFCNAPCSIMSPKDSALYRPTLLAWRAMRSGRGLLSSVESSTM